MIHPGDYLGLKFARGGRERPAVDCWGLYRLIVGELRGVWLAEFAGTEDLRNAARVARQEAATTAGDGAGWLPVHSGDERALDAVLMRGLLRTGVEVHAAPTHVGCVIDEGRMIDIEEAAGVRVRAFRDTVRMLARPDVKNRVIGIYRPEALP